MYRYLILEDSYSFISGTNNDVIFSTRTDFSKGVTDLQAS